ncbi:uncharacterized protein LOC129578170 isoform X3 [Sitodiplosis mosellana]|uniref:uncharacterized protein LOC129578170 isoform X3 n=1 Tax=Sitodiplosis mosellana TaxID=263140 RepID=UPI0024442930|nr:uncharacterized protein LOC129578170 isoform X3 [Sitodiplosis mosellana]
MNDGTTKKTYEKGDKNEKAEKNGDEKKPPSLSIDRAAFLILRVKKAFKKKRQQRKERQAAAAALAAQTSTRSSRRLVPPLLRSKTLPAIITPASVVCKVAKKGLLIGDNLGCSSFSARLSLQPKLSRASLISDDTPTEYRRKSAGSPNATVYSTAGGFGSVSNNADPYIYAFDECERHPDGTVILRIPAPHVVAARAYHMASSPSGSSNITIIGPNSANSQEKTPLYRLAKLLNQTMKSNEQHIVLKDDAPRRLSWERRDNANARIPRSSSIDSMVEAVWSETSTPRPSLTLSPPPQTSQPTPQYLQINYGNTGSISRRESLLSPSAGRRAKQQRYVAALFSAVENGHLEKARTILESTDVDINSLNSDGLSPLDVAVLSNNRSLTKMLLQHGATEGNKFKSTDSLGNHLNNLLREAENRIQELSGIEDTPQAPFSTRASFSSIIGTAYAGPSVSGCTGTETDKQIGMWERRIKGLRRMLLGWDQTKPPDPPNFIGIDVTSTNSANLRIQESGDGPIATKFKVQWSSRVDFSNIVGEREVNEWNSFQNIMAANCRITDLTHGRRYFFRACCGNVKGWGQYLTSTPNSITPSSWRDLENIESRFAGRQKILDDLFTAVRLSRPNDASEIPLDTPALQRRNPKKKTTIKQLFSAASKFQKNLRRGIFLACILYHEDKILVTNEDFLPVIEIDETYPSSLHTDYHWLMKVACTWDDVKTLRTDMERNATSAVHFRTKLLTAACQMQSALCIQDLGQLYHKPLRDSHGTVVLACVNNVKGPKTVSVLNSRWIPLNKVQKKMTAIHEDNNINEILLSSIQEQINYHQASTVRLSKGLYLGYLKMQSSVDQIQIVVPAKTPNILPHSKIRENNHISSEEWKFLKRTKLTGNTDMGDDRPSSGQELFIGALTAAATRLFKYMDISLEDAMPNRLYDFEVIELSADVSFLIVCPPAESSCAVPGQREILLQRGDLLSLPIQAFEMVHLKTYQSGIIQKYSRLSCILELDTVLANQSHREAFSTIEVQAAKERLAKLQDLTQSLNAIWKGVRWLMDVISFARDRGAYLGLYMRDIFEYSPMNKEELTVTRDPINQQLLQPPPPRGSIKSSPGRGSWPGPTHSLGANGLLGAEHSKSEQQLSGASFNMSSRYLSATSGIETSSRKNSADSNFSHSGNSYYSAGESVEHINQRLPPSRSEDTLVLSKKHSTPLHRKRATTVNPTFAGDSSTPVTPSKPFMQKPNNESISNPATDSDVVIARETMTTSTPIAASGGSPKELVASKKEELKLFTEDPIIFKDQLHITEGDAIEPVRKSSTPDYPSTNPFKISAERRPSSSQKSSPEHSKKKQGSPQRQAGDDEEDATTSNMLPGIIQVFAAYNTGLANGTSLKLHVTPRTTAREVVDLVVKQLNMAVVLKGKDGPIYGAEQFDNFCLVAVIGARERCLRDDFKPLQLQYPWKRGRLYVRQKNDLLAAIEHSNREATLI